MTAPSGQVPPDRRHESTDSSGIGEGLAWHVLSILVAGPVTWGGIGAVIDHYAGTGRLFLPIGIVVGAVTSFYLVKVRFFRNS